MLFRSPTMPAVRDDLATIEYHRGAPLPPPILRSWGTLLPKPQGGFRPIAVSEPITRVIGRILAARLTTPTLVDFLARFGQLGPARHGAALLSNLAGLTPTCGADIQNAFCRNFKPTYACQGQGPGAVAATPPRPNYPARARLGPSNRGLVASLVTTTGALGGILARSHGEAGALGAGTG